MLPLPLGHAHNILKNEVLLGGGMGDHQKKAKTFFACPQASAGGGVPFPRGGNPVASKGWSPA